MNKEDLFKNYQGEKFDNIHEAVRAYCIECSGGDKTEVKQCTCYKCPLYMFRLYNRNNRELANGFKFKSKK